MTFLFVLCLTMFGIFCLFCVQPCLVYFVHLFVLYLTMIGIFIDPSMSITLFLFCPVLLSQ